MAPSAHSAGRVVNFRHAYYAFLLTPACTQARRLGGPHPEQEKGTIMRNRTVPLLAAVLAVGTRAAGSAIVTTAEPALAVCGQTGPCPGPSPTPTIKPPPPPTAVFSTSGLTERDVTLTPGSTSPGIIQIGAKEGFTITATTQVAGATVALAGQDKFTCQAPNGGVTVTYDYVYVPHFTASPKSFDFQP